ncbi:D-glycero-alpha-D-manno-heptose-1,7-bisphosphate 7-phosphatase [uncultured Helicobacter sp.]|uniref:D-glycero-alpha-D-manno-heptose-1,7-bisphosphate 7-phosphatase n=1 Tax=uncultured Helicobacter sp. TaxID=175537 RepID=UPI003753A4E0
MLSPRKCAFFDRDGVINRDYGYVYRQEDFVFNDGIFTLLEFLKSHNFLLIVVTNQSGIARGYYTQRDMQALHSFMQARLVEQLGFGFDRIYFCPHAPQEQCACRKPKSGMIARACEDFALDLAQSLLIGDKITDMQCAHNAGVAGKFLLQCDEVLPQDLAISNVCRVQSLAQIQSVLEQSITRSAATGGSTPITDTQVSQSETSNKMIDSSSVYTKGVSPSGVPDALTPNKVLDSEKSAVCSRSGGAGGSASSPDTQILLTQNLH